MSKTKNGDIEYGKQNSRNDSEYGISAWFIVAVVTAIVVLIAVVTTSWILLNWQTGVLILGCLLVLYFFMFTANWWYIAISTAPRDIS